jgi:outer membrane receptor protein involved in Fe transport
LIGRTHPFFYEHRTASPEHRRGATSKGDRMIERLSRAAGVILVALLAAAPVAAQSALGTLRGKIADEQGGALPGVTVTVRHTETNTIQSMVTNPEGQYVLPNLRPGKYEITTELSGFTPNKQELELRVGQDLTLNMTLKVGGMTEAVEVVGRGIAVETQSTLATVITNKQIDDLPTVARDFSALATLSPGATTSNDTGTGQGTGVSISGQRPFTNGIVVDGASNQMQFYGRQANDFPQDWIQEFQVLTNSFGAEYGQAAGGMLNVITRSGANRTNGRLYGFFRDAKFDSPPFAGRYDADKNPVYLTDTPPFDQQRYGGFLGGPVIKDRLFYFGGVERLQLNSSDVLAISDYWRQFVTDTVIPTGRRSTVWLIKMDANLNQNNRGYFRYTNTHKRDLNVAGTSPGAPGPLNPIETRQTFGGPLWNVLGNWTTTLSNRAFNEFRATYGVNKPWILSNLADHTGGSGLLALAGYNTSTGNPTGKFASLSYPGAQFGATSFTGLEGEGSLFVIDNFSLIMGRHQVKFGGQITRQKMYMDVEAAHKGRWTFTTDRVFDINDPTSYPSSFSGNIGSGQAFPVAWNPSFYVQDTWQATGSLTFNLGMRYDLDNTPTTVNPYVDPYNERIVSRLGGTPPLQKSVADKNNFAPRLGVVWVPTSDRKTTIRGSVGYYYDQNHWNFTDIYINETLLALRRISLNANSASANPFWTPANTAIGIAAMRAFLAKNFPAYPDLTQLPFQQETILGMQPDYKIPYSVNVAVGMTRQFGHALNVRADYVHTHTYDASTGPDVNWAIAANGDYVRPDTRYGSITLVGNGGFINYNGLETRAEYQPLGTARVGLSYTLAKTTSNTSTGLSTGGITNPFDFSEDLGPDNNDRRHNFVLDGSYVFPHVDVQVAGIATYRSALPYSVSTSFQLDADPFSDRPEPRNSRRGGSETNLDLRLSKIFHFGGRYTATAFWEMFNVTNADNWLRYQGSLQSAQFGLPLTEGPKRRQQLGFRFDF